MDRWLGECAIRRDDAAERRAVAARAGELSEEGGESPIAGTDPSSFTYTTLGTPVTLAAGTTYYLVSHEVDGGDQWYDHPGCQPTLSTVATLNGPGWSYDNPTHYCTADVGESYVPVSLKYSPAGGGE